ncbi:MAG: Rab family GTPase, partial [Candidatus Thorarchaeota archaeon]
LGVNIVIKEFKIEELNAYTRLVLWDIAGQAKYELSRRMFFQGCMGALLIYDVTRPSTFEDIKTKWLKDYQDFTEKNSAYILIGNKIDLVDSKAVSTEEGKSLAEEINAIDFLETSAKFGDNVENAFRKLVNQVLINSHLINNRTK